MSLVHPDLAPDLEGLVTEDDEPVDNRFSAKQQRLLVEPLYSSWVGDRKDVLADANLGIYSWRHGEPLVPDALLALEVEIPDGWWDKEERCYLQWEYGKPPDVVVEIVSNLKGGEDTRKKVDYARMGVPYYAVFDPQNLLSRKTLRLFELSARGGYRLVPAGRITRVGLGLLLWNGQFEDKEATWLRWCDLQGNLVPTGRERAQAERERAQAERERAQAERERAEAERERAQAERERAEAEHVRAEAAHVRAETERQTNERLRAKLRAAGIDPDEE